MRIIIESPVFVNPTVKQTDLHALFHLACKERHWILTEPLWNPINSSDTKEIEKWLHRQDSLLRDEYELALRLGLEQEKSSYPNVFTMRIANVVKSDWQGREPVLLLSEAIPFLNQPLNLLLENSINDRNFLLAVFGAVATQEQQKQWDSCLAKRWIQFEHAGGITTMLQLVGEFRGNNPLKRRTWVMFDSDALRLIGGKSRDSEKLKRFCENQNLPHHQLNRRAIENYLPLKSLHLSMSLNEKGKYTKYKRQVRDIPSQELLDAFKELSDEQRYCFNMKNGLNGDAAIEQSKRVGDLYDNLNSSQRRALAKGFGENIAVLFKYHKELITKKLLDADGQLPEIETMLAEILALV